MEISVYTDASIRDDRCKASIGGFISENSKIILQFSNEIDYTRVYHNSNFAELIAIENGLMLAKQRGIKNLVLFSDSKSGIELIQFMRNPIREDRITKFSIYIKQKKFFLQLYFLVNSFLNLTCKFILRELNGVANVLSRLITNKNYHREIKQYTEHLQWACSRYKFT